MQTLPRWYSGSLHLTNNGYVGCGRPAQLGFGGRAPFTIEAWVHHEPLHAGRAHTVFARFDGGRGYGISLTPDHQLAGWRQAGGVVVSSTPVRPYEWHHVAMTYDGATLVLYVDGVEAGRKASANELGDLSSVTAAVGAWAVDAQPRDQFEGMIGDVTIWSTARTLDQVNNDSVDWKEPVDAGLVANYDFTQVPFVERSGDGLPLDPKSGAMICLCIPGLTLGGSGWVNCGSKADLSLGGFKPYTIEAWIGAPREVPQGVLFSKINAGVEGEYQLNVSQARLTSYRNVGPWGVTAPVKLAPGDYYHVATSYDGKTLRVFVNGNLQAARDHTSQPAYPDLPTLIGANFNRGKVSDHFNGQIQNIRLWKVAMDEIDLRQWMYNDPVDDEDLVAAYDFTVSPPVDTTGNHTMSLEQAATYFERVMIDPWSPQGQLGFTLPVVDELLGDENPPLPPPPPTDFLTFAPQPEPFGDEHLAALLDGLGDRERLEARVQEAYALAAEQWRSDPLLNRVTTHHDEGDVVLVHHTSRGDVEVFRAPRESIDPCLLWWMQFVYQITIGFFGALGLVPTPGNIAGRVWALLAANPAFMNALRSLAGVTITVAAGVEIIKVLYEQGLLWSILKMAFTSAGWWALVWVLRKAIAFATGLEAADLLAGFIVWAAQLTVLSLKYTESCHSTARAVA
jgi:hypothetical protein